MASKIKNILIFLGIALVLVLVYFLVFKKSPEQPSLVSSTGAGLNSVATNNSDASASVEKTTSVSKDFLALLLNVRNIRIDETIFSDPAFLSLRDSTIELVSDGNEGRPNPFAPLGTDTTAPVNNDTSGALTVVDVNNTGTANTTGAGVIIPVVSNPTTVLDTTSFGATVANGGNSGIAN
jgi:hypothetical protein